MKRMNLKTMLSAIGLLAVATPSALSVVACGVKSIVEDDKVNLTDVIKSRVVDGSNANSEDTVLGEIARLNSDLKVEYVEIKEFKIATEVMAGSAKIVAKTNSQYSGAVAITISALPKIALVNVIKVTSVDGNYANTSDAVLTKIGELNANLQLEYVEIKDFKAATEVELGSAKIVAKSNTKYTGEVEIIINKLKQIALVDVIKNTRVEGEFANDAAAVLVEVGKLNSNLTLQDVEIKDFKVATKDNDGSAKIVAKPDTKYIGEVAIIITLNQEDIVNFMNKYWLFFKTGFFGTKVRDYIDMITGKFIKNFLPDQFYNIFNEDLFKVNKLFDLDEKELDLDSVFDKVRSDVMIIDYNYGTFTNQRAYLGLRILLPFTSPERDKTLQYIIDAGNDFDKNVSAWFAYFDTLLNDVTLDFTFNVGKDDFRNPRLIQQNIFNEVQMIVEYDLMIWNIPKGYNPETISVLYRKYDVDQDKNIINADIDIVIEILFDNQSKFYQISLDNLALKYNIVW